MKNNFLIFSTLLFFACGMQSMWGQFDIESFNPSIKSEHLTLVLPSQHHLWICQGKTGEVGRLSEYNEKLILTPDYETLITDRRHNEIKFKPVIFKNQQKGFRIVPWIGGAFAYGDMPIVSYIVLSDTPMEFGENDVEMVMDNWKVVMKDDGKLVMEGGEWVKIEDSKSLIIDKLGWLAEILLRDEDERYYNEFKRINPNEQFNKKNPDEYRNYILTALIDNGLITLPPEYLNEETSPVVRKTTSETQLKNMNAQINDVNALVADEKSSRKKTSPYRSVSRAWFWWFALFPVAAGAWYAVRLRRRRK